MPDNWKLSDLIPICKGKGEVKLCGSYSSVKLLEHDMKMVEKCSEKRLRRVVDIDEMQMGFILGKSKIYAIFSVRQIMEKYELSGKKLFMLIVDL